MISALPSETDVNTKSIGSPAGAEHFSLVQACALVLLLMTMMSPRLRAQAAPPSGAGLAAAHPEVRIPVGPMGYMPPGDLPAFYYYALVELHYIDASHLMFAFNSPGLLKRDNNCPGSDAQRMVRAVVFQLPSGQAIRQADWELYDFMDFLWRLDDGQLLLRRCNQLESVGVDLQPRLLIQATGTIEDVSFSPDRSIAVIQEKGAPPAEEKNNGAVPSILEQGTDAQRTNVDFIQMQPLRIIARSEVPLPSSIPVTASGIIEVLTAPKDQWVLNMQVFHGAEHQIASVHSLCAPAVRAISDSVLLVTTCDKGNQRTFQGFNLQGLLLWQIPLLPTQYYPRIIPIANDAHFAIEFLRLKNSHAAPVPLTREDIDGEDIDIYDTLSGVRIANFETAPAYTGGSNVDFSPDGTRMAVLHDGAIEIYAISDLAKTSLGTPH
jgi:hypothetical protein